MLAQTRVSGRVTNDNGRPLAFVNVVFLNSSEGTTTAQDGSFSLQSKRDYKTIEISFLGYDSEVISLPTSEVTNLEIALSENLTNLEEVRILKGKTSKRDNPALDILRKIWANKHKNGTRSYAQYEFRKYEKFELGLDGIDSSVLRNPLLKGMEFILDYADSSKLAGRNYLPFFINESVYKVYGDNAANLKREDLLGNRNSGFNENHNLIEAVRDLYDAYDIYDNYLKIYNKSFVSPLSTTGIHNYNYVLADSAYLDNKWCYQIIYYPRRKNELTFKGDFWVNDTSWAVKKINLQSTEGANINWVRSLEMRQEYEMLNDTVFLISKDEFTANFSMESNPESRGLISSRSSTFKDYEFNKARAREFYSNRVLRFREEIYKRDSLFWENQRTEELSRREEEVFEMMDSLGKVKSFKRLYDLAGIAQSGYVEFNGWDFGPLFSAFGYNEVEGFRLQAGARTYFTQHDPWRIEGYLAYGLRDDKFKFGIAGKVLLDRQLRLILSGGTRRDVEQLGAGLTNTTDVLGRSLASSALLSVGDNDKLSKVKLSSIALELEPWNNFQLRFSGSYRILESASENFSLAWYLNDARTLIKHSINQAQLSAIINYTPGRVVSGYGVERRIVNSDEFPTFFLEYNLGVKNIFNSDHDFKKLSFFYDQPWEIGGLGRAKASLEAGKTFGTVPLGLLDVVPGNQTYFAIYNSFPTLDFYEFVTDTYVAAHFNHSFNGRLFSRIPLLRDLNLRELVGIRGVWGEISEANKRIDASGIPLNAPSGEPYWEYSFGIGNILKAMNIQAHFRGNYFEMPEHRDFALTFSFQFAY
ncbi:DUF5686 family protein [Salegentibacter sp. HM20]